MAKIINIESRQHKKEHFVYIGEEKIAVYPLGPDMSDYEKIQGITIFALRGWYYISLDDKAQVEASQQSGNTQNNPEPEQLKPRDTRLGF